MTEKHQLEFSRPILLQSIGDKGLSIVIEATSEECDHLARWLGLNSLNSLTADLNLMPRKSGRIINLKGSFRAKVVQTCVVTLETLSNNIKGSIDLLYDSIFKATDEKIKSFDIDGHAEKQDNLESPTEGHIDIGEAVSEQLALEIDPFPRKLGIPFVQFSTEDKEHKISSIKTGAETEAKLGHFSELIDLKEKLENKT
jgi:hypothetical protein